MNVMRAVGGDGDKTVGRSVLQPVAVYVNVLQPVAA